MKHGDKAKAKSAKAKASGKEAGSKKVSAKSSSKGAERTSSKAAAPKQSSSPKAVEKSSVPVKAGNGKGKNIRPVVNGGFSNAVIGEAFRRAIKKYPAAFRRLTD